MRRKTTAGEFFYLAFIAIMAFVKAIGYYEGQRVFTAALVVACCCLVVKLAATEHTVLEYLVIAALLLIGVLVYRYSGEKALLINFMIMAGIKGVSVRKSAQTWLVSFGLGYAGLFLTALLGLHEDQLHLQSKVFIGTVVRHDMGYVMPSVLQAGVLCVCALVLYLAEGRFTKRQKMVIVVLLAGVNIYIFTYSMAFTGLVAVWLLLFMYVYVTIRGRLSAVEGVLAQLILPLCLLIVLVGPFLFDGWLFDICNKLLNGRYAFVRYFFTEYPVTLFGTRFLFPDDGIAYTLDSSFAYLFMYHGVIPFAILMLLYLGTIHRMVRQNRLTELAILLAFCITGLSEQMLFNLSFKNVTLLFIGEYLYELLGRIEQRSTALIRLSAGECPKILISDEPTTTSAEITPGSHNMPHQTDVHAEFSDSLAGRDLQSFSVERGENGDGQGESISLLQHRFTILKLSDHHIYGWISRVSGGVCAWGASVLRDWMQHWKKYVLLAAAFGMLAGGGYSLWKGRVDTLYITETVLDSEETENLIYVSEEEVENLRRNGAIVLGYVDEDTGLYLMEGQIAALEYARQIGSAAVWSSAAGCVIIAVAKCRKKSHATILRLHHE